MSPEIFNASDLESEFSWAYSVEVMGKKGDTVPAEPWESNLEDTGSLKSEPAKVISRSDNFEPILGGQPNISILSVNKILVMLTRLQKPTPLGRPKSIEMVGFQ